MHPFFRFLKNGRHKHPIDYVAEINSGVSAIALYPQLLMAWFGNSLEGLSPVSFAIIALNSCVWLIYGMHRKAPPLIISSTGNAIAASGILFILLSRS